MKNFEARYSVSGTSALKPKFEHPYSGAIIAFPGQRVQHGAHTTQHSHAAARVSMREHLLATEMVHSLCCGSARGTAYDHVKPWQAVVAGGVFIASSLAAVLVSL